MMTATEPTQLLYTQINFSVSSPFTAKSNLSDVSCHFEDRSLDDLLLWSLCTFGDKVAQVTSFGPTGMVILDHLARLSPGIRVITLDTQFLFDETYALFETVQKRYAITLDVRRPTLTPEAQGRVYGKNLWETSPDRCCYLRKVAPLQFVLNGLDAWFTGLRRDQAPTRANMPLVNWDTKYNLTKINPLAGWTRGRVWRYILKNKVPYNPLHDQGYASIGCSYCTSVTATLSDERSGRWAKRQKTECGIHLAV